MLKWLRRILAVIAILIALSVLVPLAYIEGDLPPGFEQRRPPPRRP